MRISDDREQGNERSLAEYQALFPGHEEEIAREYRELQAAPAGGAAPLPRLRTVGRFELLAELGRGGQGEVYLAEDRKLQRRVALKVLSLPPALRLDALERFKIEAQLASRLSHPGICTIHEAGEADGLPYIAMQYVAGESLVRKLAAARSQTDAGGVVPVPSSARPDFPPLHESSTKNAELSAVLYLIERVARAMHVAHEAGIVHRDIKPANIMVTPDGEPVILDFGLARDEAADASLTVSGALFGTPAYMSPEQVRSERSRIDRRTDVYSLGATLFECLTLRAPFTSPTREGLFRAILSESPPSLRKLNPRLPADLQVVVETALEKEPDRRYQTALDLAEELRRVRERRPILARPVGALVRLGRWAQRNPRVAGASAAAVLALVSGLVVSLVLKSQSDRNAARALEQTEIARAVTDFLTEDLLAAVGPILEGRGARGLGQDVSMRTVLDEASRRIDEQSDAGGRFADKPLVEAAIRACLGHTYHELGEPHEAERHYRRALELQLEGLGEDQRDTLQSLQGLAGGYLLQGRVEEAEPLLVRARAAALRALGERDRLTLHALLLLAMTRDAQGRIAEMEQLYRELWNGAEESLPEHDPLRFSAMHGLALAAWRQGRTDEAETWFLRSLELERAHLGEDDWNTLLTRWDLGKLYHGLGRLVEAAVQLEAAAAGYMRVYPSFTATIDVLASLGALRRDQGRVEEARELAVQELELRSQLARCSRATPRDVNDYAWALLTCEPAELRDPDTALTFALSANERTAHANPGFLDTLALAHHRTGDTTRALEIQERALALLPPGESSLRTELEEHLDEFRAVPGRPPAE